MVLKKYQKGKDKMNINEIKNGTVETYTVKDNSVRGCSTKSKNDVIVGDMVCINDHFEEVTDETEATSLEYLNDNYSGIFEPLTDDKKGRHKMTNQRSVSQKVLDRYFNMVIDKHEMDDYPQEFYDYYTEYEISEDEQDYYIYLQWLISNKHCKTCKGNNGCNYCSIYQIVA
jgi:hypothetical protein